MDKDTFCYKLQVDDNDYCQMLCHNKICYQRDKYVLDRLLTPIDVFYKVIIY